jgi:hypothetical protein
MMLSAGRTFSKSSKELRISIMMCLKHFETTSSRKTKVRTYNCDAFDALANDEKEEEAVLMNNCQSME